MRVPERIMHCINQLTHPLARYLACSYRTHCTLF